MNTYINYLLEANLCLLLFYGAYVLLLRNETNFSFKRIYLAFTVLASLLFPLFTIGLGNSAIPRLGNAMPAYILPEIVIGGGEEAEVIATPYFNIWKIIFIVYAGGVIILFLKTIYQLILLSGIIKKSTLLTASERHKIYETNKKIATFSFFKWIIIGEADQLKKADKQQIIRHELEHIKNYHSIDMLMVELARILFWFNPLIYPLKKNLSDIHEYQADEKSVRDLDIQEYCSLLARITLQSAGISLANHFNKSITVKRIEMMKSMKRKMKKWKIGAVAVIATGLFFTIACQDQVATELNDLAKESTMAIDLPANVRQKLNEMKAAHPENQFVVVEVTNEDERAKIDELISQHGGVGHIKTIEVVKENIDGEERGFILVEMVEDNGELAEMTKQDGEIFVVVEEVAEPVGGMEELYGFIMQNVQYPEEAKKNGVSGKVFIEFVIEKDGSISNVTTKKGIGYGCDEEAERVVKSFPNWKPAKQRDKLVRQKMILPISFRMGNDEVNNHIIVDKASRVLESKMKIESSREILEDGRVRVTGKILDENEGPLPGVNVIIEGSTTGTISDGYGKFEIVMNDGQKLVVSHVGYDSKTLVIE